LCELSANTQKTSVAEPHHFYAAPAPGENFEAAPAAPVPAPTLLCSRSKIFKGVKGTVTQGPTFFYLLMLCNENCGKYA
jgi:hypothetical protein